MVSLHDIETLLETEARALLPGVPFYTLDKPGKPTTAMDAWAEFFFVAAKPINRLVIDGGVCVDDNGNFSIRLHTSTQKKRSFAAGMAEKFRQHFRTGKYLNGAGFSLHLPHVADVRGMYINDGWLKTDIMVDWIVRSY